MAYKQNWARMKNSPKKGACPLSAPVLVPQRREEERCQFCCAGFGWVFLSPDHMRLAKAITLARLHALFLPYTSYSCYVNLRGGP